MTIYGASDHKLLESLGERVQHRRLRLNLSQQELAERAGVGRVTISRLENSGTATLLTLVQILRALEALDDLEGILPDSGPSPLELAERDGKRRRRATGRRGRD